MITSVMYHYVRPIEQSSLRYLAVDDFIRQLDWLAGSVGDFISADEWEKAKAGENIEGVLLTFDDGLKDHMDYVFPILQAKGIFAIFFVSSSPLVSKNMLAVHLTHKLLSLGRSEEILDFFKVQIPQSIWPKLHAGPAAKAYTKHLDLDTNVTIKKIVNYLFADFNLSEVLDLVSEKFISTTLANLTENWYMSEHELKLIAAAGMKIGSHANSHRLLSILSNDEIYYELSQSKMVLEATLGVKIDEFCYPYGGPHSYNETVQRYLAELDYSVSHDVSPRRVSKDDFLLKYALPRFNCNELPFGIAHSLKS